MKTKPAYIEIYEKLREDIAEGAYAYGERLPSKRTAAAEFGVSVITAEHAYRLLEEEGYIRSRERSGFFVCYDEKDAFAFPEPSAERKSVSGQESGERFPFSVYARAVRKILSDRGEEVLVKSPGAGRDELRLALARYLARSRGVRVSPEDVVVGSGAEYLYNLIVALLGRGLVYGIESPSYHRIEQVYAACGVKIERLTLGPGGIRSDALDASEADVLHITPYRSFPSGITATAAKKREYLAFAERRGGWIVEDDFESEITPSTKPEETLFSIDGGRRVIYLNTFSRTVAPAVRIGYLVLPEPLRKAFEDKLGSWSCTVPTLDQLVLAELLDSGNFERSLNRMRRRLRKNG